jgi:hypothetical protein
MNNPQLVASVSVAGETVSVAGETVFVADQIVCIAVDRSLLFGEVVQHITARQQCWVRPLVLAIALTPTASVNTIGDADWQWHDLRQGSDLLLPEQLFRAALDVEVLPLMTLLFQSEAKARSDSDQTARQQIHGFVQQVCQCYPEAFQR